jgi:lipoprotein NlpI
MNVFKFRFLAPPLLLMIMAASAAFAPRCAAGAETLPYPKLEFTPDSKAMSDMMAAASSDLFSQRFDKLEADAATYRHSKAIVPTGDWQLGLFYGGTASALRGKGKNLDFYLGIFDAWIEKKPDSITARVAKANALLACAWSIRGSLRYEASEEQLKEFHKNLTAARLVLREAKKLPEKCPYWWVVALRIGNAERWDRKTYDDVFQEAVAFEPQCDEYYLQKAQHLWLTRGDNEQHEWQKYAIAVADARGGEAGDTLYARILWAMDKQGFLYTRYANPETSFQRYDRGFEALLKAHPGSLLVMNAWLRICSIAGSAGFIDKRKAREKELFLQIGEHADIWVWNKLQDFILLRASVFGLPDYYARGMEKLNAGDNQGALEDLNQALAMLGRNVAVYSALAAAKINLKRYDDALTDIDHAIIMDPKNAWHYAQKAYLHTLAKQWQFALASANRALELDPDFSTAYGFRALAEAGLGQNQKAVEDFQIVLEFVPEAYANYANLAFVFYNQRNWTDSLSNFREYLKHSKDPDSLAYIHFYIWLVRARQGQYDAASKELKSFLAAHTKPQNKLGDWPGKIGAFLGEEIPETEFLAAAEDKDESRALEKKTEAYFYAGMTRLIAGNKSGAREFFEKIPAFKNPDSEEARSALAELKALSAQP